MNIKERKGTFLDVHIVHFHRLILGECERSSDGRIASKEASERRIVGPG